jgi:hypothetical protein
MLLLLFFFFLSLRHIIVLPDKALAHSHSLYVGLDFIPVGGGDISRMMAYLSRYLDPSIYSVVLNISNNASLCFADK